VATYIVGDIQGCLNGLIRLLKKVNFSTVNDRLIAVGDLVGRGSQALETIDYLYSLENSFESVLGNHDLHFLAIYAGIKKAKPCDKLDDLLASSQIKNYVTWLRQKPLALLANSNTLVTHAGLYPNWSVKKALIYNNEVSEQLKSKNWQKLLSNMYGNQPSTWSKNLNQQDRLRFIVNALTRMRFIENSCDLDFDCKTSPQNASENLVPWFEKTNKKLHTNQQIVFGHWAALNGQTNSKQFVALDTGYVWGQSMTLLNLSSGEKYTVKHLE
jgi:bis(5'-nucleosyl)-tetraphosphatase (symmetrical)